MAADEGRVEPLEGDDARAPGAGDGCGYGLQPCFELGAQAVGGPRNPGCLTESGDVFENLGEAAGVLLHDPRRARQSSGDLDHVLVGDRADVADRLGDDQVRFQRRQPLLVEAVERLCLPPTIDFTAASISPAVSPAGRTVAVRCGSSLAAAG